MTPSTIERAATGADYDVLRDLWSTQFRLLGWRPRLCALGKNETGTWLTYECPSAWDSRVVVVHANGGRLVTGSTLEWIGPGRNRAWHLPGPLAAAPVGGAFTWATLDGVPVVASGSLEGDPVVVCGFDPADVHVQPTMNAVLRRALRAAQPTAAWLDMQSIVGLRMDDPGASASVHLEPWSYERLGPRAWREVGDLLAHQEARMSVAYTPGWVDDGDRSQGELLVDGRAVERVPGRVHPSPLVRFIGKRARSADCASEFAAICELRDRGLCETELHGYTHVHPDLERWAASSDRHHKLGWYRELGPDVTSAVAARGNDRHPIALGLALMRKYVGEPRALVCPGNACSANTLDHAYRLGLDAVVSRAFAVRGSGSFSTLDGVVSESLETDPVRALATEAPVIAGFHDRDLALEGVGWLEAQLARWRAAGARRFVDLRDLTSAFNLEISLERQANGIRLRVDRHGGVPLAAPFGVLVEAGPDLASKLELMAAGDTAIVSVEPESDGLARVQIPAGV